VALQPFPPRAATNHRLWTRMELQVQHQAPRRFRRDTEQPTSSSVRWEDRRRKPVYQVRLVHAPLPTSIIGPQAHWEEPTRARPGVPAVLTTQAIKFTTTARLGFRGDPRTPLRRCSMRRRSRRKGESHMLNVRWRRPRLSGNRRMVRTGEITLRSWHSSADRALTGHSMRDRIFAEHR
jgi:hypothetical protein